METITRFERGERGNRDGIEWEMILPVELGDDQIVSGWSAITKNNGPDEILERLEKSANDWQGRRHPDNNIRLSSGKHISKDDRRES